MELKNKYDKGVLTRQVYLDRAYKAAELTLPSLIPPEYHDANNSYKEANQSIGADGTNNLANKFAWTLLPPNDTFFKFTVDRIRYRDLVASKGKDPDEEEQALNKGLSEIEQYIKDAIEADGDRITLGEASKHLIVAGNVLLVDDKDDGLRYYPLSRYVVRRDYSGNVLEVITVEKIAFQALPIATQELIIEKHIAGEDIKTIREKEYDIYTGFTREKTKNGKSWYWKVSQEVAGVEIEESRGIYPKDKPPFIALRYNAINGESYGRGLIEEYIGDLRTLDTLSKAINETSVAAARFIPLVNPTGVTKIKSLANAKNGQYIPGRKEDISVVQSEKYYDLKVAEARVEKIERRLSKIFLLADSVTRDAERVTAKEIEYMIQQLEKSLGNVYSILMKEFQRPYLTIKLHHLKLKNRNLPDLLKDKNIKLTITTGIEALGRNSEVQKLDAWLERMGAIAEVAQTLGIDISIIGEKYANGIGLNINGLLPSKEERAEMEQRAQEAQMMRNIAPELVRQYGQVINQNVQAELQEGTENDRTN